MKRFYLVVAVALLGMCTSVNAQVKSKAATKPITTQTATTEDGKAVILSSNGTWKYAAESTTPVEATTAKPKVAVAGPIKTGNIDIEAGLVFNSGDVKPVGRATFYILREDGKKVLLTQEHFDAYSQDTSRFGLPKSFDKWSLYEAVLYMDGRIAPTFALAAKKALDTAAINQATTGFDGKASFSNVPVGDYFLFGYYSFGKQTTYWNVPVSVKPGANKIILDNDNMKN